MLEDIRHHVALPEGVVPPVAVSSRLPDEHLRNFVLAFTREIFSGSVSCDEREDGESPGEWSYEIAVTDHGEVSEILARNNEWHRRLAFIPFEAQHFFRLLIDAR